MIATTALFALMALTGASASSSLSLALSGANSINNVDSFSVTATVTNTGTETLKLFKDPRSALSNFPEDTFTVSSNGNTAPFVGAKAKYTFHAAKNFVTLAPGESTAVTHDLSAGYNFTSTGTYEVEASNLFYYQDGSGDAVPITADVTSVHTADLSGSLVSRVIAKRSMKMGLVKRASFNSCSSSQSSQINTALDTTVTYVANAASYLSSLSSGSTRYTTWFGTYSSSRKSTVYSHYTKIQSSNPKTYTYDCSCTDDSYAYTYPSEFGYIYLCDAFWTAPTTGTDSKAGTIVHESTHFTSNGGTQDYAYGQTAAKSLAKSNPAHAIMNADSHEYFAENNPALS